MVALPSTRKTDFEILQASTIIKSLVRFHEPNAIFCCNTRGCVRLALGFMCCVGLTPRDRRNSWILVGQRRLRANQCCANQRSNQ
jgi:hypothetical protein